MYYQWNEVFQLLFLEKIKLFIQEMPSPSEKLCFNISNEFQTDLYSLSRNLNRAPSPTHSFPPPSYVKHGVNNICQLIFDVFQKHCQKCDIESSTVLFLASRLKIRKSFHGDNQQKSSFSATHTLHILDFFSC